MFGFDGKLNKDFIHGYRIFGQEASIGNEMA
jgi:hypothetical protein